MANFLSQKWDALQNKTTRDHFLSKLSPAAQNEVHTFLKQGHAPSQAAIEAACMRL
jgi:hypothetical protein